MPDTITIKLPDGSAKQVPRGTTALQVAEGISPRLAQAALAARSNGDLIDLTRPLEKDAELRILTERDPEALQVFRHSSAHLLAAAVLELFPETKLGHGPATESGFFYDFYRPTPFTPEDLEKIEKKMMELVERDLPYAREFLPRQEGLERFKSEGDFMKCHFIEHLTAPDEKISIYRTGKFQDFCRGPHIPSTGKIKAFKLLSIAGAYWLGDEKNPQLQRIYGTSFYSKKELEEFLRRQEEPKKRDHRVLGKQLDLFSIQDSLKSYRDLPVRYGELGTVYRYERSGVMHGLLRVRGFTQDDAHIFCTPEQIEDEIVGCMDFALAVLSTFGFSEYQVELSTWDPKDRKTFMGSDEQWNSANRSLENALRRRNIPFKLIPGEAAFYGPKIDVKLVDAIGRL